MKVNNAVKSRRSVRDYQEKKVKDSDIRKILEAGRWAPSGLNNQPWKFKIIADETIKDGLGQFTKYDLVIKKAPLAICVFLDKNTIYDREKDIMAVGACIQNMLLVAQELNIGSCWLGEILNKKQQVEDYLGISEDYELMAVLAFGYAQQSPKEGNRKQLDKLILD
jgi:nitroreductase